MARRCRSAPTGAATWPLPSRTSNPAGRRIGGQTGIARENWVQYDSIQNRDPELGKAVAVVRTDAAGWVVAGRAVERAVALSDITNLEALAYVQQRLRSLGVDKALARAGMKIDDIDLYEVNEAFASVPLAWLKVLRADPARLNVNGGAIALGHPLACTGVRLTITLARELQRSGLRYGISSACVGGGQGIALLIENPNAAA